MNNSSSSSLSGGEQELRQRRRLSDTEVAFTDDASQLPPQQQQQQQQPPPPQHRDSSVATVESSSSNEDADADADHAEEDENDQQLQALNRIGTAAMSGQEQVKKDESKLQKIVVRIIVGACMFALFSGSVRNVDSIRFDSMDEALLKDGWGKFPGLPLHDGSRSTLDWRGTRTHSFLSSPTLCLSSHSCTYPTDLLHSPRCRCTWVTCTLVHWWH